MLQTLIIILPVFFSIAIGVVFGKLYKPKSTTLVADLVLYIYLPCMYFNSILTTEVDTATLLKILVYAVVLISVIYILIRLIGRFLFRMDNVECNQMILASCFPNTGNIGLSIIQLLMGSMAMDIMLMYQVAQNCLMNTLGIYAASNGKNDTKTAIKSIVKLPSISVVIISLIMRICNIPAPKVLLSFADMLGKGVIPIVLINLGIQLSKIKAKPRLKTLLSGAIFKYVLPLPLALALSKVFFPNDIYTIQVMLMVVFMPTAATVNIISAKYSENNELVPMITLFTTIGSVVIIPIANALVQMMV